MTERKGDIPLDELVNAGLADLTDYFPNDSDGADMVTVFARRKRDKSDNPWQSSRRIDSGPPLILPDYVVCNPIKIRDPSDSKKFYEWVYNTPTMPDTRLRRVFVERNQLIELDIEESLSWISASDGSPSHDETRKQLEQEASMDNVNNQIILQLMYNRVEQGLPILEYTSNTLYKR